MNGQLNQPTASAHQTIGQGEPKSRPIAHSHKFAASAGMEELGGFLFGNINEEGKLEDDFLDEVSIIVPQQPIIHLLFYIGDTLGTGKERSQ